MLPNSVIWQVQKKKKIVVVWCFTVNQVLNTSHHLSLNPVRRVHVPGLKIRKLRAGERTSATYQYLLCWVKHNKLVKIITILETGNGRTEVKCAHHLTAGSSALTLTENRSLELQPTSGPMPPSCARSAALVSSPTAPSTSPFACPPPGRSTGKA